MFEYLYLVGFLSLFSYLIYKESRIWAKIFAIFLLSGIYFGPLLASQIWKGVDQIAISSVSVHLVFLVYLFFYL